MEQFTFEQLPQALSKLLAKVEGIEKLLQENSRPELKEDVLLTIEQAAEFLKLSIPTIYSLVSKRKVPANKKGKRLYFSKDELTGWIKSGRMQTMSELEQIAKQYKGGRGK